MHVMDLIIKFLVMVVKIWSILAEDEDNFGIQI